MTLRHSSQRQQPSGFTLVELLVVIGIIAILISTLLPVLSSARKAADKIKCAAALREIGNVFKMYAGENNNYYPPMRAAPQAGAPVYHLVFDSSPPIDYNGPQAYWMFFLVKYLSKGKFGAYTGASSQDFAMQLKSVLWGCPSFTPYTNGDSTAIVDGTNVVDTGYGMNGFPEYTPTYPAMGAGAPYGVLGDGLTPALDTNATSYITSDDNWRTAKTGRWYKANQYSQPAERALVGDCRAYVLEAMSASSSSAITGQSLLSGSIFWAPGTTPWNPGQTSYDFYRHGSYPKQGGTGTFAVNGGKVGYNVLFVDGHVVTLISKEDGFKAARMRFPG